MLAARDYLPTNAKVDSPLRRMQFTQIDPTMTAAQMERWRKVYDEVVLKQGRR